MVVSNKDLLMRLFVSVLLYDLTMTIDAQYLIISISSQNIAMGSFMHACEGEIVCKSINPKIPYFNAPIFIENKTQIGKVDEILGPLNEVYFTVKTQDGIQAGSYSAGDKFYIGTDKLLPIERFLPKPKVVGKGTSANFLLICDNRPLLLTLKTL